MRRMETVQDLIEEAKVRTVVWAICIFAVSYFLTHTSKSMWTNIPMSILIVAFLRYLSFHVSLQWKNPPSSPAPKPSHLSKRQLSTLTSVQSNSKWRRKVEAPAVEAALEGFINELLKDFVVDLWYDEITPDREAPEIMRSLLLDIIGEVSRRVKEVNLVDLLTRDMVDLIGNQMDLYRRTQSEIGAKTMITLSSEERDERLKQHLMASKELHPALFSPQSEHKVLQQIVGGILAIVLKPQEAQCALLRSICRELLACLVLQPLMNFACPNDINELIELIFLTNKEPTNTTTTKKEANSNRSTQKDASSSTANLQLVKIEQKNNNNSKNTQNAPEWAVVLDAASKRRTQVLQPENLENMWTKGRHYQKKLAKSGTVSGTVTGTAELADNFNERIVGLDDKYMVNLMTSGTGTAGTGTAATGTAKQDFVRFSSERNEGGSSSSSSSMKSEMKRSSSSPDLEVESSLKSEKIRVSTASPNKEGQSSTGTGTGTIVLHSEGSIHVPKIRCRVVGAYFEKLRSKTFAVYSIAVSDSANKTWFVKRRYRNFERLHRLLKEIPNYSLHLPPKNFLSSSTDDQLVHQRCILLDKYLRDLLSMANVAEQHEVWDFLSANSKNYSFGKSPSVMKTLAVNMDDAMDDIMRQFKGVTDNLTRIVTTPPNPNSHPALLPSSTTLAMSWAPGSDPLTRFETNTRSLSDDENNYQDKRGEMTGGVSGWHSDNETKSDGNKGVLVMGQPGRTVSLPDAFQDSVPPEWTPPNVSVPLLNLVDNLFQLKRKGWLRRQVLWISKQIVQLVMEDAIDDWMVRQIHWLRNPNIVSKGILWVQNTLWPNGTFFTRVEGYKPKMERSPSLSPNPNRFGKKQTESASQLFESQLEASRRANDVKKLLLEGTPPTLVSLIGQNSYKRCARDIYYFLQSSVCLKQLAYSMLELVVISVFPELRQLITEIHEKAHNELY